MMIQYDDPELEALRAKHQVRLVTNEEEGFGLDKLPDGVYGFTSAVAKWDAPLFSDKLTDNFEFHKLPDGIELLVGYVSQEEASGMDMAKEPITIHLFHDRQEEASTLVSIPLDRVIQHKEHSERTGQGLELELDSEA